MQETRQRLLSPQLADTQWPLMVLRLANVCIAPSDTGKGICSFLVTVAPLIAVLIIRTTELELQDMCDV